MKKNVNIHKALHTRNLHKQGYDFSLLITSYPPLAAYVNTNIHGNLAIDFACAMAVKALNTALLKHYYQITNWSIPADALCPPIPGRVDYIHYIAELMGIDAPTPELRNAQSNIKLLDIGTGANGIYILLASQVYGWQCVGTDINTQSLENVAQIIASNSALKDKLTLRLQADKNHIFNGIIQAQEYFDVCVCNPPFHASADEALKASQQKRNNLARHRDEKLTKNLTEDVPSSLNFGGTEAELWCKGGERLFLKKFIKESQVFSAQCRWFTCLVSKSENIKPALKLIRKLGAIDSREITMTQGNKTTRVLAWTFMQ